MSQLTFKRQWDEASFRFYTGHQPVNDDLERVNCQKAGEEGHSQCGILKCCLRPAFMGHRKECRLLGPPTEEGYLEEAREIAKKFKDNPSDEFLASCLEYVKTWWAWWI